LGNLELDSNGWIKVNENFHTSIDNVFAGGDIINGGTTAVQAVAEGMKAAVETDRWLRNNNLRIEID